LMIRDQEIIKVIRILQTAEEQSRRSSQGRIYLELALIKICNSEMDYGLDSLVSRLNHMEAKLKDGLEAGIVAREANQQQVAASPRRQEPQQRPVHIEEKEQDPKVAEISENPDSKLTVASVKGAWNEVDEALRAKRQMVIRASLFEGEVTQVKNGVITLQFPESYSHNKKRLEKNEFRKVLEDTISMILGEKVHLNLRVASEHENSSQRPLEDIIRENDMTDIDIIP
ncbi:MAG: DNA polymerase III subunit gamma/tau, partial [Clostridium sp.]|nr:DNA polymerase III subunit gamma/tau [Clostridium sp.]